MKFSEILWFLMVFAAVCQGSSRRNKHHLLITTKGEESSEPRGIRPEPRSLAGAAEQGMDYAANNIVEEVEEEIDCGICTNVYNPVCSVEGVEYYNPCWAVCGMDKIECSHKCPCSKQTAKNRNQEQETTPEDYEIAPRVGGFSFDDLSKASAEMGMKLYGEEAKKTDGNLLFSPFSIQSALSMVGVGAKGSSLLQIMSLYNNVQNGNVVGSLEDMMDLKNSGLTIDEMKELLKMAFPLLKTTENVTIETANSVFLAENFEILDSMRGDLQDYFNTSFISADFSRSKRAADQINGWVEEKTHDKIKDLIDPSSLNSMTKMVLVNALYFKGLWSSQFDAEDTEEGDFILANGDTVKADFMTQVADFNVGHHEGHSFVALPYSGDKLVMYLFTPNPLSDGWLRPSSDKKSEETVPLSELEKILTLDPKIISDKLKMSSLDTRKLKLELPRFKIEATLGLAEDLKSLGVTSIFTAGEADLSGITGRKDLYVSDAVHKAMLEVNEEGSEGAAATAVITMSRSLPLPPAQARFDRPFIFFIKDERSGMILFQGRVMNPTL